MMLAFPDLAAAPRHYTSAERCPLAAKLALELAVSGPIEGRAGPNVELRALQARLQAWLDRMHAGASSIRVRLTVSLGQAVNFDADSPDTFTVWISGPPAALLGRHWLLERRWKAIEAMAPGLAPTALYVATLAGLHSFAFYTPAAAEDFAMMGWWHGNEDESELLEEYRAEVGDKKAKAPDDMPTRAWFDKVLPRDVCRARRRLNRKALGRLARRRDVAGEISRHVLELDKACAHSARRREQFKFEYQDDTGFMAVGYAGCLRWNAKDPMLRIYDDYANEAQQAEGVDEAIGWVVLLAPEELPRLLAGLEQRFGIARRLERLLPLIAEPA